MNNWPKEGTKKSGRSTFKGGNRGTGKSGTELDAGFRKPFPNMGETKTGREGR